MNDPRYANLSTARFLRQQPEDEDAPQGRQRVRAVHPLLLAALPPLAVYARSPSSVMWWELLAALGCTLAATAVVYVLARRLYASQPAAALATSWTILMLFAYGCVFPLERVLLDGGMPVLLSPQTVLPLWATLLVLGLFLIGRKGIDLTVITHCAHVFGGFAVAGPILLGGIESGFDPSALTPRPAKIELQDEIAISRPDNPPDVYYVVVSGYGDRHTLQKSFRYENDKFLSGLQKRGFAVAAHSRANYPTPELSMAAALNMQYLGSSVGAKSQYYQLLQRHLLGRLLAKQGYRYYHLGGPVDGLRSSPLSHDNYRFSRMPTQYTDRLASLTPLQPLLGDKDRCTQTVEKFDELEALAKRDGPKFVLAYFSSLQPPWTFDQNGEPISTQTVRERSERENYVNQLRYVNRRLERVIETALEWSKGNVVIVVQADEGPRLSGPIADIEADLSKLRRREGVLTAVYLPRGEAAKLVPSTLSPVNTFRLVLSHSFAADLPRLADRSYFWKGSNADGDPLFGRNVELVDVTDKLHAYSGLARTGR